VFENSDCTILQRHPCCHKKIIQAKYNRLPIQSVVDLKITTISRKVQSLNKSGITTHHHFALLAQPLSFLLAAWSQRIEFIHEDNKEDTKSKRQSFQLGFQTYKNSNWPIYVQIQCITGQRVRRHKHVHQENITLCLWMFTHNKKSAHNQGKRTVQQHKIQVPLYYLPPLYSSDLTFSITICEHKPSPCTLKAHTLHCM